MRFALTALLAAAPLAAAQTVTDAKGVAALYARDGDGSLLFQCSAFKLASPRLAAALKRPDALVSAGHCAPGSNGASSFVFATWDDGRSFIRVRPVVVGKSEEGYDVSFWLPFDKADDAVYSRVRAYAASARPELNFGEKLASWAHPGGEGLAYLTGDVTQPRVKRPIVDDEQGINWTDHVRTHLPCVGGCSGAAAFDAKGEVVGVVIGVWEQPLETYVLPIGRALAALSDRDLQRELGRR